MNRSLASVLFCLWLPLIPLTASAQRSACTASYDATTGVLTLEAVDIGATRYSASFSATTGTTALRLVLSSATSTNNRSCFDPATVNSDSTVLTIPDVAVGDSYYTAVFTLVGGKGATSINLAATDKSTINLNLTSAAKNPRLVPDAGTRIAIASNPWATVGSNGTTYLGYTDRNGAPDSFQSAADGLTFSGATAITFNNRSVDSRRTLMPDGLTWRLYMMSNSTGLTSSYLSTDGNVFTAEAGTRYTLDAGDKGSSGVYDAYSTPDKNVVLVYVGDVTGKNNLRMAKSTDNGVTFGFLKDNVLGDDAAGGGGSTFIDNKTVAMPDGRRRMFTMRANQLQSFITTDGYTWTRESGTRISYGDYASVGLTIYSLNDPVPVYDASGKLKVYVAASTAGSVSEAVGNKNWAIVSATWSEAPGTGTMTFARTLTVTRAGAGSGTVAASGATLTCPGTCSASVSNGADVVLTATPASGSAFTGWSGACSGTSTCSVSMLSAREVSATFGIAPSNGKLGTSASQLSFGSLAIGASGTLQTVTLTNTGTGALGNIAIGVSGDFSQTNTCSTTLAVGATCTVNVQMVPTAVGALAGSLTLASDASTGAQSVTLSGTGLARGWISYPLTLSKGWNLLGNSLATSIDVATLLGDATTVNAVWSWNASSATWRFYTPALSSSALATYAAEQKYGVLSSIAGGDGYWVNAIKAATLSTQTGLAASSLASTLPSGWSLVASGSDLTPAAWNNSLSTFTPAAGVVVKNIASLWHWSVTDSKWLYYSPALSASALSSYLAEQGMLDFTSKSKTLGNGTGFWVNMPATSTTALTAVAGITAGGSGAVTAGSQTVYSSTKLAVSWTAPSYTVDHYEVTATETVKSTSVTTSVATNSATLTGLKAATSYTVTVKACADYRCTSSGSGSKTATTPAEYWQLQGSGATVSNLSKIVSDGNSRISATRFGSDAGVATASRIQLYYGPSPSQPAGQDRQTLGTAITGSDTSASLASSYLSFTSFATTTGIVSPPTTTPLVSIIQAGQAVPLKSGAVRLYFEAFGSDNLVRIMYLDSVDGYIGRDFNTGSSALCTTVADYSTGGGCVPTVSIGVEGDTVRPNNKITNARQFKIGFPILDDWRWDQAAGTFMVFTTDSVTGCSSIRPNHGYAVWDGSNWNVQYSTNGCPQLFVGVQAAFPMHLGGNRYKMYFGVPAETTGRVTGSTLPFLGPKKLIYADARSSGSTSTVDYDDWEAVSSGRNVVFLWPDGSEMDATSEGYIDDFHFLAPTGSLDLQVMYLAITDGSVPPIGAAAILLNP